MSFLHGSVRFLWCVLRNDVGQFLSHICVRSLLGHEEHAGMVSGRANRMQCGEAVVPVSWLVEQVVLVFLLRTEKKMVKTNFVVVSATLLGTQDPRQALESVSQEQPRTFLEILGYCVALPVFNYCSHRSNHFATTCVKKCWKHYSIVRRVPVCTWKLTSSGRLRLCERQLLQVLIVGIGHFRCRLHLDCLAVQRELPRRTSVCCRQKQI